MLRRSIFLLIFLILPALLAPAGAASRRPISDLSDLSLEELLDLEVTAAARHEQPLREAPAAVTIVTRADLDRWGCRTLGEALGRIRGFYLSDDRENQHLGVRGFGLPTDFNNRVLVLLDGQPLNDNITGAVGLGPDLGVVMEAIDRIEVVRGPASALYGASAMFAVINLIPRQGGDRNQVEASAETGAYGYHRVGAAWSRSLGLVSEASLAVQWGRSDGQDLYYPEYDHPETGDGVARDLDWEEYWSLHGKARHRGFTVQGVAASRRTGIPTGSFGVVFNDPRTRSRDANGRLEIRFDRAVRAGLGVQLRGSVGRTTYVGISPFALLGTTFRFREEAIGDWVGGEGRIGWEQSAGHRLVAGAECRRQVNARYRSWYETIPYYTVEFPYRVLSGYLQEELQLRSDLSAVIGLRLDDRSPGAAATSPRAALLWHPDRTTGVKLLYGQAFRTPTLYEMEYAEPGASKGNRSLSTERIRTVELVVDRRLSQALMATASLYHYHIDDLIEQRLDPTDGLAQFRNTGQADARGLELEATFRLPVELSGAASCSWQRTTDRDGERLPNSPSLLLKGSLSRPFGRRLILATDWRHESGRRLLPRPAGAAPAATDPYLLGNLRLIARPSRSGRCAGLSLTATVDNLLDTRYQTPGGTEHRQAAIEQDGRCWRLGVQYGF